MASVHRKNSGCAHWHAVFRSSTGKQIWLSTKLSDRRKALAIANVWEESLRLAEAAELSQLRCDSLFRRVSGITKSARTLAKTEKLLKNLLHQSSGETLEGRDFQAYCADWLATKQSGKKVAPATLDKYRRALRRFIDFLPEKRRTASLSSIAPTEIEHFINAQCALGLSGATVSNALAALRSLFSDARRKGIIQTNPAEAVDFGGADHEERIPFSQEGAIALLKTTPLQSEWRGMILLGLHCGVRITDAANLRWANIDLLERTLSYQAAKTARRKRGADKVTTIALHADLLTYFESLPATDNPLLPVFPTLFGRTSSGRNGLSLQFRALMESAGITQPLGAEKSGKGRQFRTLSFHSLRHSFVSRLANLEVSADLRKTMVGHSTDSAHDRYTHLDISHQHAAVAKLPSVLPP